MTKKRKYVQKTKALLFSAFCGHVSTDLHQTSQAHRRRQYHFSSLTIQDQPTAFVLKAQKIWEKLPYLSVFAYQSLTYAPSRTKFKKVYIDPSSA